MGILSVKEWLDYLSPLAPKGTPDDPKKPQLEVLCEAVFNKIDGYGFEYGFDPKVDAVSLANAYKAIKVLLLGPSPSKAGSQVTSYAIAIGNSFDGIKLYGPFDSFEGAERYASQNYRREGWVIPEMLPPMEAADADGE